MKYGLIAGCALVTAMTSFADMDDLRVSFETKGVDTYQDGKTVLDGEFYALVWVANGAVFKGFQADGALVDAVNNKLVVATPHAKDGRLYLTLHQIPAAEAPQYANGEFVIELLDTRNADGKTLSGYTVAADGKLLPKAVNGYSTVLSVPASVALYSSALGISSPVAISAASAVPADAPLPQITGIKLKDTANGRVAVLSVKGTVAYLRYVAAGGDSVEAAGTTKIGESAANGAADADTEIEIVVPADKASGLFKVTRQ